ncbi:MAG: prolyl oligopeptidase family serine peptidase [Verrucomicrobia bacterium]|nr:prolyl oligopeptidase family serine peptidase [Verrucomicrobiota bacterium]
MAFGLIVGTLVAVPSLTWSAEPAPGKQVEQTLNIADDQSIAYLLYLPKTAASATNAWPLMLFLHGRGESYGPLSLVGKWGPPRMAERGDDLPFLIASPQCPGKESWAQPRQQKLLAALLDHLIQTYPVATNKVYLTGLSMGGYGSWRLAADHPERFAAVVPICGAGKPEDAGRLKQLPIWVFHGTEDKAVPFARSVEMVDAIRAAGGTRIKFTTLEHVGHNSWEAAYATPELWTWLSRQSR